MPEGPIATRLFYLKNQSTPEPVLTFHIYRPYQPEADYPRCAYELLSDQHTQRGEVTGVDSPDCIITCLSQVGTMIAGLNESVFGGQLRWEASPSGGRGLGLPTIEDHWPFAEAYREALRDLPD